MKRFYLFVLFSFAIGCGSKPSSPTAATNEPAAPARVATTCGKPSADEAAASIREYFTDPGVGCSDVQIETLSEPVEAPVVVRPGTNEAWFFSTTMTCNNVVGEKLKNKDCLLLIARENGRPTVKECYNCLERLQQSPVGKEWFTSKGFAEPAIVNE